MRFRRQMVNPKVPTQPNPYKTRGGHRKRLPVVPVKIERTTGLSKTLFKKEQ